MNTYFLYKFYFKDSFQGILSHPFLKKKYIRIFLSLILIILYLFYFYLNVKQVQIVKNISNNSSLHHVMIAKRVSLSSLYGLTCLLAIMIFILLESGIHLNKKSIYFTKALPFSKKDILNSERLFYLTLALLLFELFIIIIIPMLVLITTRLIFSMFIIIGVHILFLGVFQLLRYIESTIKKRNTSRLYKLILIIISYYYFVYFRFKIDLFIAHEPISLFLMIILPIISGIFLFLLSWNMQKNIKLYINTEYKQVLTFSNSIYLLGLIRTRFFKITSCLIIGLSLYLLFLNSIEALNFLFPFLSLIFLYYGNTTMSIRTMFKHLRIKVIHEMFILTIIMMIIQIPSLLNGIITHHDIQVFLYGMNLSLSALILGILLPKRISNINELVTSIVMIILMIIYLLTDTILLLVILIILWMISYLTLKEATK